VLESFLFNLAANLATDVMKTMVSKLMPLGNDGQQALRRAYEHAFTTALSEVASSLDRPEQTLL